MPISSQVKLLCKQSNISLAELARRIGKSPQALNSKLKRESFTISDLNKIALAIDARFICCFELSTGERI